MKNLQRIAYNLFVIVMVTGCANTATVRVDSNKMQDKSIHMLPSGIVKVEGVSSTIGGAFGIIGVLIEHAATAGERAKDATQLSDGITNDELFGIVSSEITGRLGANGAIHEVIRHPPSLQNIAFEDWFNGDQRQTFPEGAVSGLAVDYGFQNLAVTSYMLGKYADGAMGIRIIDRASGQVIARARTYGVGDFGGEKISKNLAEMSPEAQKIELVGAFTRLIKRLTNEALDKVGIEYSGVPAQNAAAQIRQTSQKLAKPSSSESSILPVQPAQAVHPEAISIPVTSHSLSPASKSDPSHRLRSLNELLKDGLITKEDYDFKKQEILKHM